MVEEKLLSSSETARRSFLKYAATAIIAGVVAGVGGYSLGRSTGEAEASTKIAELQSQVEDLRKKIPPPVEIQEVTINPAKTVLIIVDMQNDFCKVGGALGPQDKAGEQAITNVALKIRELKERGKAKGMKVIYTQDYHYENDPEFKIWGPHCVVKKENGVDKPTWGQLEIPELTPDPDDIVVHKGGKTVSYDCFYATYKPGEMDEILAKLGVDTCIVTGTVSNICVNAAVLGCAQRMPMGHTIVPVDGIVSLPFFPWTPATELHHWNAIYKVVISETGKIKFA
ncbi:MAG: hypothetical protein DRO46_02290 [Candidatus Hecatellales archaeon]|nr:MAG: hypothetical protein DRO46_02290 [Candidatus Hecatellales archaeon]